jgi:hypothetical protein
MQAEFWLVNLKARDHVTDLGGNRRMWTWIVKIQDGAAWTGLMWLRTGTSGGLFYSNNKTNEMH